MLKTLVISFLLLVCAPALTAQESAVDGPYIKFTRHGTLVQWTYPENNSSGKLYWGLDATDELPAFPGFHPETFDPTRTFSNKRQIEFNGVSRIAALSDIHGQYDVARSLLMAHGIIDEDENWTFGDGHLVIVGDVFDRGDQVTAALWLIHHMQMQAEEVGGKVHFLLGNHETMVMEGDTRYLHARYERTSSLLRRPYQNLFSTKTYLGRWLRSLPLTVKINNVVYVHGGFSKEVLKVVGGLEEINTVYHRHLMTGYASSTARKNSKLDLLYGNKGPLWYRGYFVDRDFTERDIDKILEKLGADHMVVGHTSFNAITRYFGDRVYAVDSSIKFGAVGELLLIEDGIFRRGTITGEVLETEIMK